MSTNSAVTESKFYGDPNYPDYYGNGKYAAQVEATCAALKAARNGGSSVPVTVKLMDASVAGVTAAGTLASKPVEAVMGLARKKAYLKIALGLVAAFLAATLVWMFPLGVYAAASLVVVVPLVYAVLLVVAGLIELAVRAAVAIVKATPAFTVQALAAGGRAALRLARKVPVLSTVVDKATLRLSRALAERASKKAARSLEIPVGADVKPQPVAETV